MSLESLCLKSLFELRLKLQGQLVVNKYFQNRILFHHKVSILVEVVDREGQSLDYKSTVFFEVLQHKKIDVLKVCSKAVGIYSLVYKAAYNVVLCLMKEIILFSNRHTSHHITSHST